MKPLNLLSALPGAEGGEVVEALLEREGVRIERIVSRGQCSPPGFWYDQEEDEWVLLLGGAARLEFEDGAEACALCPGDAILIPARRRHRVAWTDPDASTVWLAVFLPAA